MHPAGAVRRERGGSAPLGDIALHWLDGDGRARVIADRDGAILWSNAGAADLLEAERHVKAQNGRILGATAANQVALAELLFPGRGQRGPGVLVSEAGEHLLVTARALGGGWIGLTMVSPAEARSARYVDFRRLFGLTAAEDRLLGELLAGHSAERAADCFGISLQTARSHIRHIYAKLHVSTREELFALVARYRLD